MTNQISSSPSGEQRNRQPYGDLTRLNKQNFIAKHLGEDLLLEIANNYLDLLETSSAVYEKNGDYALGIFSSGWCRFLDNASRELCGDLSNEEALACGKWLCHESCWTDISRKSIESGEVVCKPCHGGLNIYAVPIKARGDVVGAINFGYGTPPTSIRELESIASKYNVDVAKLEAYAKSYTPRTVEVLEAAKANLRLSARFIGEILERRMAEEELKESKQQLRAVADYTYDWEHWIDPSGKLLWVNPAVERISGYTVEECLAHPNYPIFLFHPDDHRRVQHHFQAALQGKVRHDVEFRLMTKSGWNRWISVSYQPILDPEGASLGHRASIRDISSRKRAEQALAKSNEKYSKIFQTSPSFLLVSTLKDARYVEVNRAFEELTGYTSEEMIGRTAFEMNIWADPEDRKRLAELLVRKGAFAGEEVRIRTKAGSFRTILLSCEQMSLDGEDFIISAGVDITVQKNAEEMLRQSEEMYSSLFHGSSSAMLLIDPSSGVIIDANEAASRFYGYTREELLAMRMTQINTLPEEEVRRKMAMAKAEEQKTFRFEHRLASGEVRDVEVFSGPVQVQDTRYVFSIIQDVTSRVRAEEALQQAHDVLEKRVRERTMELEQASRAKDEFLANMSHELRTPIAGVIGMTDVLLQQNIPGPVRKDLQVIRGSSESMVSLLNDILDLSRIEQGTFELHPAEVDLGEMIRTIARPFEIQAQDKGLAFELSLQEPGFQLFCDPDRLGQVLKNMLSNAVKFTEQGTIRLEIRLEQEGGRSALLHFAVSDTGIGIPERKLKDVFQSFTQLDPTYSKKFGGIGLGLAITRRLVELMGGEVWVRSRTGQGSTFSCSIPFQKAQAKVTPETRTGFALADFEPLSILLAEDNPVNRLFLSRTLLQSGHRVTEAQNGLEALHKLQEGGFDLILMDIQMPEMDGLEATREIREHGMAPCIPIIALTAYAMKGDREKFLEAGMDAYVSKPVDFGELAEAIGKVRRERMKAAG